MRKIFWAAAALVCMTTLFGLQYRILQTPGAKERLHSFVRDTPASIFYPVFIGFAVLVLGPVLYIMVNQKRWSRMATKGSVFNAKKVALSLWRVSGQPLIKDDWAVMRFRHVSWGRHSFILPVRPGHPDIERFRRLNNGDTVEFEVERGPKGLQASNVVKV